MQTFLPLPDFDASAAALDPARLGKQRVEALQILRALELPEYGWANHPAVAMWRGRTPALVAYGAACVRAWRALGHADSTADQIGEFAPATAGASTDDLAAAGLLPSWVGDEALHRSHRSALVRKDPAFYRPRFGDVPDDLPYVWPGADDVAAPAAAPGRRVWVCRAPDATTLGVLVGEGVVGLDTSSGIDVPADLDAPAPPGPGSPAGPTTTAVPAATGSGGSTASGGPGVSGGGRPVDLRALLTRLSAEAGTRKRPGKALRQLEALVGGDGGVAVGDEVAVPVAGGRELLLGEVSGPYSFAGVGALLPHRRPVRWQRVVPRAALARPAQLQDPRSLFAVHLALDADPAA